MIFRRGLPQDFYSSLDELFDSFYDSATLRLLYSDSLIPALGLPTGKKLPKKAEIAAVLSETFADPKQMKAFIEHLPTDLVRVIEGLVWVESVTLAAFEDVIGMAVAIPNTNPAARYYEPQYLLRENLGLLVLWMPENRYYSTADDKDRANYNIALPPAMRAGLKPYFPKPDGYYLKGSELLPVDAKAGLPKEIVDSWTTFDCSKHALQDAVILAGTMQRGGIPRTKSGAMSRAFVRKLCETTRGGEIYPGVATSQRLPFFRHEFIISFLELLSPAELAGLADASISPEAFLRSIPKRLGAQGHFVHSRLLPHLKDSYAAHGRYEVEPAKLQAVIDIFNEFSLDLWVTRKRVIDFCRYRDRDGCFFPFERFRFDAVDKLSVSGYTYNRHDIIYENRVDAVTWPLFSAVSLALAALGLVEIAYTEPYNHRYHAGSHKYLSPYEGVQAVRLTALGVYAFGQTDVLEKPELESVAPELHFAEDRMLVQTEQIDAITEAVLRDYMEQIGPGLFKMTRASFLKGCQTTGEVAAHIRQFRQRIPDELPPVWNEFFDRLAAEPAVLKRASNLVVYQLPESAEIRNAFVQDPILREHAIKVGGWRVAITKDALPAIEKRLHALGFFAR